MDAAAPTPLPRAHRRLVLRLLLLVVAAFGFGFALVPLYDVFCEVTGFNDRTPGRFGVGGLPASAAPAAVVRAVDTSRTVTVEFTGTVMPGLPWEVRPLDTALDLHPGELQTARFLVRNTAAVPVTGHAVPSVTPGQAAQHFEKIDCFCFTQQTLLPGEAREMAVAFVVKPALDREVRNVTLAYAFFRPPESTPRAAQRGEKT